MEEGRRGYRAAMKLRKFLLRYYPPGVVLVYEQQFQQFQCTIDLLDIGPDTDVEVRPRASSLAGGGD